MAIVKKIHSFKNRSSLESTNTRTTGLSFINEEDSSILLTGTDDGIVRVWSHFDDSFNHSLTTAWRALSGLVPGRGAGLVLNWQQEFGFLLTSGDVGVIRIWDMEREFLLQDLPSSSDHSITCLSSSVPFSHCIVAGYSDGAIRLFDQRLPEKYSLVTSFMEHKSWIVNAHIPKTETTKLISGSAIGEVKIWDLREISSNRNVPLKKYCCSPQRIHVIFICS